MTDSVAHIERRHTPDPSRRRKPLRLKISRRLEPDRTGRDQFVTQVRFGKKTALLLPWDAALAADPRL
jgi:hypothetical protein